MKTILNLTLLIVLASKMMQATYACAQTLPPTGNEEDKQPPSGKWEGKIQLPGAELRVFFQIEQIADTSFRARMASPDQGANNIPVQGVSWKMDSLILDVQAIGGTYAGKLSENKTEFDGLWKQRGAAFKLILHKTKALEFYPKRPQEPTKPYPYREQHVKYPNNAAGISLAGTLTLPQGSGPFPAVLLITGSGSQNREEEIMGHKPFLVLADYLTRIGIAVLRVDDRGTGESTGNAAVITTQDNVSDVLASFEYLRKRPEIIKEKIGLVGHSEGGMIAPIVASQSNDVNFIVLLAGIGLPGDQLHRRQVGDMMRLAGTNQAEIQKVLSLNDQLYAVIKAEKDAASIEDRLSQVLEKGGNVTGTDMQQVIKALAQPWFRYFINFDPVPYLQKVKCPVLAVNGSKDIQVAAKENLAAIEEAIKAGGNTSVTVMELEGLNHLFQTADTGSMMEYAKIQETISPTALKVIGDWIQGRVH